MQGRKLIMPVLVLLFTTSFAFCQSEVFKPVVNNIALYKQKKDLKFLGAAKISMDSLIANHADSLDLRKNVYKDIVYSTIVYIDSLNVLKLPDTLFRQSVIMTENLLARKKINRFYKEMEYVKRCLANVYIRKGFEYMNTTDFANANLAFLKAQRYVPSFQQLNFYIAYANNKLGKLQDAAKYYTDLIKTDSTKAEYMEAASGIYKSMGDTAKALAVIQKGRKILPGDRFLLMDEANIYNNSKNYTALAPLLDTLLNIYPDNADIAFVAANCYDHLNQYSKAEALYLHAIDLNNSAYDPVFNLGLLYFKESLMQQEGGPRAKYTRQAVQLLQKANEISPNNVRGLQVLQLVYTKTQNKSQLINVNNKLKQLTN
jgi:tetratricopeptide (TPR) repeat protein